MANQIINAKLLNVCKTTEQWAEETSVISKGLICVEFTTNGKTLVKIGDGTSTYTELDFVAGEEVDLSGYSTTEEVNELITNKISAMGNVLKFKGIVATVDDLPTTDNATGDIWFVGTVPEEEEEGTTKDYFTEYVWTTANKFEFMGRIQKTVDLSGYATKSYVDTTTGTLNTRVTALEEKIDTVPTATSEKVGGIKIGSGLSIDEDGVASVDIAEATTESAGLMSATDKTNLDSVAAIDHTKFISSDDTLTINCTL